jgi:hypothetical protein
MAWSSALRIALIEDDLTSPPTLDVEWLPEQAADEVLASPRQTMMSPGLEAQSNRGHGPLGRLRQALGAAVAAAEATLTSGCPGSVGVAWRVLSRSMGDHD